MPGFAGQLITLVLPATILDLVAFLMVLIPTDFGEAETLAKVYQAFALLAVGFLTTTITLVAILGEAAASNLDLKPVEKANDFGICGFLIGTLCIFIALGVYVSRFFAANIWIVVLMMAVMWLVAVIYAIIRVGQTWNK